MRRVKYKTKRITKKQRAENFNNGWKKFFQHISDKSVETIRIKMSENFFQKEIFFDANRIYIIRGDNGQGKSSLLKNIFSATTMKLGPDLIGNLKQGSNNQEIGSMLNDYQFSPYRMRGDFFNGDSSRSNVDKNLTLYCDFSIGFYKNQNREDIFSTIQEITNTSNGERKISGINDIFLILKVLKSLKEDEILNSLNIIVIMDEPESGLSAGIQEEFKRRVEFYVKKMNSKINLTFFIASHSYVWKENKYVKICDINDFKEPSCIKKVHRKVFV